MIRDYGTVNCDVAREALSARIDGEREPVPSARVDEHIRFCRRCSAWDASAREQAVTLRRLAGAEHVRPDTTDRATDRATAVGRLVNWCRQHGLRAALALAGLIQLGIAVVQAAGMDFGLVAAHHGAATGAHLLNESTAWCAALGIATLTAAVHPSVAAGLASVLVSYVGLLSGYVVADAVAGQVTAVRIASHAPIVAAAVLAVLVWRTHRRQDPPPQEHRTADGESWPPNVRGLQRSEHLRHDDSAA